jgi:hypothetical protein
MEWQRILAAAPWGVRGMPRGGQLDGYFYVISGRKSMFKIYADTWRSPDGIEWELMSDHTGWGRREADRAEHEARMQAERAAHEAEGLVPEGPIPLKRPVASSVTGGLFEVDPPCYMLLPGTPMGPATGMGPLSSCNSGVCPSG